MASRQAKQGAQAGVYVIVVIGILGVGNWLAKDYNKTLDVTANKRFTLSDQTKKVVGDLKKEVNVYYFEKSDHYDQARDLFDRYHNLSSNFKVNYVDPDKKPDVARIEGMRNFGEIIIDSALVANLRSNPSPQKIISAQPPLTLFSAAKPSCLSAFVANPSVYHALELTPLTFFRKYKCLFSM